MDAVAFMRGNRAYFEDFMTRSTYHSNAIEGSTLSYAETYAILWNDNSLQVTATARELYEAINHKYALSLALEEMQVTLSERLVKRIAQAINKNINEIGGYRTISVLIRGAEHIPPKPNQVNQLMMQLVHEYNHADDVDPYLREARFHIRFERVHPFEDGNGRTGRILVNRGLLQAGLAPVVVPFERRAEYLAMLADGDSDGLAEMLRSLSHSEDERTGLRVGRVRLLAQQAAGDDPDLDGAIRARVGSARLPGLGLGCEGCIAHGTLLRRRFVRMLRRIPETRGE